MLSYQHIYHAGCAADVHKHAALAIVLSALSGKGQENAVTYAETHAGRGLYDLRAPEALKTGEAKGGVARLAGQAVPDVLMPYMRAVTKDRGLYPGSPLIAARLLGTRSRLHLCELHPREFAALEKNCGDDRRITLHRADGYETVAGLDLAGRSLVLIDPSFEIKGEYEQAAAFVERLHALWPEAVLLLWMPLLAAGRHEEPLGKLAEAMKGKLWRQDALFAPPGSVRGLYGSMLAGINIPAGSVEDLERAGDAVSGICKI